MDPSAPWPPAAAAVIHAAAAAACAAACRARSQDGCRAFEHLAGGGGTCALLPTLDPTTVTTLEGPDLAQKDVFFDLSTELPDGPVPFVSFFKLSQDHYMAFLLETLILNLILIYCVTRTASLAPTTQESSQSLRWTSWCSPFTGRYRIQLIPTTERLLFMQKKPMYRRMAARSGT